MYLKPHITRLAVACLLLLGLSARTPGQIGPIVITGAQLNQLEVSVPFLTIAPDPRSAGLGDFGVGGVPDVWSQHWNVAKYPFSEGSMGFGLSYTPWLTNLVSGLNLFYLPGFYSLGDNVFSMSVRYFSLGDLTFTTASGTTVRSFRPFEFSVDGGFSRKLTDHLSAGAALRYIHSELASGQTTGAGDDPQPGITVAADLGVYYRNETRIGKTWTGTWTLGAGITNMGPPVSYSDDQKGKPIPTKLGLGGSFRFSNQNHALTLFAGANKLLVPTPPVTEEDTVTGELILVRGKMPPESVIGGMVQSFYDAPGILMPDGTYSVFREELNEIFYNLGLEYVLMDMFAFRTGYFTEHASKGNRSFFTIGAGIRYQSFRLDFSYLIPTQGRDSPVANTIRVGVSSEFGNRLSNHSSHIP